MKAWPDPVPLWANHSMGVYLYVEVRISPPAPRNMGARLLIDDNHWSDAAQAWTSLWFDKGDTSDVATYLVRYNSFRRYDRHITARLEATETWAVEEPTSIPVEVDTYTSDRD